MRYIPNSPDERRLMLESIGLHGIEELFDQIPAGLRLSEKLGIGEPMSEPQLLARFREFASANHAEYDSFLGAGAYSHFIPTIIDPLISRSEFFTAYTPYQPEQSQGTLQYVFEFQTMICQLTGMDVANASMYDGSTAVAEAVLMGNRLTRRNKFIIARTLHPHYREVVQTYIQNLGFEIDEREQSPAGTLDVESLRIDDKTAAVVVQSPNFLGGIEDLKSIGERAHQAGALLIVAVAEAMSLAMLRSPGECGADIVAGEAQSFGIPLSYGGPYCGLFSTRDQFVRQMPGRLVGEARDAHGTRGYVLTLSTREQHIRREKATSNICTNQGLFALMATIYLATMGKRGVQEVARQNFHKAHYAASEISRIPGFGIKFSAPFFNEFVVETPLKASDIAARLLEQKIIGGIALGEFYPELSNCLLVCVTETSARHSIDRLVSALKEVV
jgi:glycine dehydrogenase subunit 1